MLYEASIQLGTWYRESSSSPALLLGTSLLPWNVDVGQMEPFICDCEPKLYFSKACFCIKMKYGIKLQNLNLRFSPNQDIWRFFSKKILQNQVDIKVRLLKIYFVKPNM